MITAVSWKTRSELKVARVQGSRAQVPRVHWWLACDFSHAWHDDEHASIQARQRSLADKVEQRCRPHGPRRVCVLRQCQHDCLRLVGSGFCILTLLQNGFVFVYCVRGTSELFSAMLASLLAAPMRFFDVTPIGRILNRAGTDIINCDLEIPLTVAPILFETSSALLTVITALVLTQWFGLVILPLLWIYARLGAYFIEPLREVNRIVLTTRSPLLSLVSEGIDGSTTIRAFGDRQRRRFQRLHDQKLEVFCAARMADFSITQWFNLRVQLLSSAIVALLNCGIVAVQETISPGLAGLLVSYGLAVPAILANLVSIWSRLETAMISPERIFQYINVEHEGHRDGSPHQQWPTVGRVVFDNVSFRYKPNDPLVLKNVSFDVQGGEKIGIVG
ncbi:hypothetical protein AeNC1_017565, partial [Aphanomyces euteiches]